MSIGHWTHRLRSRFTPLAVVLALLAGASVQIVTATPAMAAGEQATIGMPFAGKWASSASHPSSHGPVTGGTKWAMDVYAFNADVRVKVNGVGGVPTMKVTEIANNCGLTNGTAGKRVRIEVKVGGISVGYVSYEHLDNVQVSVNDAVYDNDLLGKTKKWAYDAGCWEVNTDAGVHTHMSFRGNTCYVGYANSASLSQGEVVGVLGSSNIGNHEQCTSVPSNPPSQPIPWGFETLEGDSGAVSPHSSDVGAQPSAIVFNGLAYVFHYDVTYGNLRYARHTSNGWVFDILDGAGGANGRYNGNVGNTPTAVVYQNQLHVFYRDTDNTNLRHTWSSDGVNWSFDNVDGDPGSWGQLNANLGQTPTAIVFNNLLYVFYKDGQNGNLRQAILNGTTWSSFLNIDGDYGSLGGYDGDIGDNPTVAIYGAALHLFYRDNTHTNLRHAWTNGSTWYFENLDGDVGSISHYDGDVGAHPLALMYGNSLHLFYRNEGSQSLRHSWHDSSGWHFEALTGPGSVTGYQGNIGLMTSGVNFGSLQLFSYDVAHGDLAHIFHNSTGWHSEALDGNGGQTGRVHFNVGTDSTTIIYGGSVHVFYYQAEGGNLRHSWSQ